MKREDPYTKEQFEPRRTNQRFASSSNRIKYHNQIARQKRMITRDIDYAVNNNWNVLLKQLAGKEKAVRTREFLLGAGFNFNYFQRAYKQDEQVIYRIYNCGFTVNKDSVVIIKIDL